jgi:hypothetical protein
MLLAMIVEALRDEAEGRDAAWIIAQQCPDVSGVTAELLEGGCPGWLAKALDLGVRALARRDATREAKRIRALLPLACEEGLLTAAVNPEGTLYAATGAGRRWAEEQYAELGRREAAHDDELARLTGASRLCKALLDNGSRMQPRELQGAVFPPLDWAAEDHAGHRAQQRAYNATIPQLFERAAAAAIRKGWVVVEADGAYRLTPSGASVGAVYFDDWR